MYCGLSFNSQIKRIKQLQDGLATEQHPERKHKEYL
jgi:hypothetical protein